MFYLVFPLQGKKSISAECSMWAKISFVQLITGNYCIQPTLNSTKWLCELFSFFVCWFIEPTLKKNAEMQGYMIIKKLQLDEYSASNIYTFKEHLKIITFHYFHYYFTIRLPILYKMQKQMVFQKYHPVKEFTCKQRFLKQTWLLGPD